MTEALSEEEFKLMMDDIAEAARCASLSVRVCDGSPCLQCLARLEHMFIRPPNHLTLAATR